MSSPMDLLRAILSLNKLVEISCKALYIYLVIVENISPSFHLLYLVSYNNLFLYSCLGFSIFCFDILVCCSLSNLFEICYGDCSWLTLTHLC